jgi:predicted membrane channel-forming protein YqfA (hemolysin III family)
MSIEVKSLSKKRHALIFKLSLFTLLLVSGVVHEILTEDSLLRGIALCLAWSFVYLLLVVASMRSYKKQ